MDEDNKKIININGKAAIESDRPPDVPIEAGEWALELRSKADRRKASVERLRCRANNRRDVQKRKEVIKKKKQDCGNYIYQGFDAASGRHRIVSTDGQVYLGDTMSNGKIGLGQKIRSLCAAGRRLIDVMPKGRDIAFNPITKIVVEKELPKEGMYLLYQYLNGSTIEFWLAGFQEEPIKVWEVENYYSTAIGINQYIWDLFTSYLIGSVGLQVDTNGRFDIRFWLAQQTQSDDFAHNLICITNDSSIVQSRFDWFPQLSSSDIYTGVNPYSSAFVGSLFFENTLTSTTPPASTPNRSFTMFNGGLVQSIDYSVPNSVVGMLKQYIFPDILNVDTVTQADIEANDNYLPYGKLTPIYAIDSSLNKLSYRGGEIFSNDNGIISSYKTADYFYELKPELPQNYVDSVDPKVIHGLPVLSFEYVDNSDPFNIIYGPIIIAPPARNKYFFIEDRTTTSFHGNKQYVIRLNEVESGDYSYSSAFQHNKINERPENAGLDLGLYFNRELALALNQSYFDPISLGDGVPWRWQGQLYKVYTGEKYTLKVLQHRFEPNPDVPTWGRIVQEKYIDVPVYPFVTGDRVLENTRLLACCYVPPKEESEA